LRGDQRERARFERDALEAAAAQLAVDADLRAGRQGDLHDRGAAVGDAGLRGDRAAPEAPCAPRKADA
jgi:hypothetical protein